ncbi:MAG: polyphosphate kinase 2 family protein [Kiritimatiellia bacterium]|nr:polyphosphate kinase 2 family protein [Kiritimatiellia bacterium]
MRKNHPVNVESLLVRPGSKAKLAGRDPSDTLGIEEKKEGQSLFEKNLSRLPLLQQRLYAESRQALLIILQAMDGGGKDGTIRRVLSILNPQGCHVKSFKSPSSLELSHDFLWRIHHAVPAAGEIGVFNRSHYEDVLIVRVHEMVPRPVWSERYDQINDFERMLSRNGVRILKFFLNISKEEQKERLQARLDDPEKHWKADPADARERLHWDEYQKAYEAALTRCSTPWAPWYIIPADRKWFRDLAVSTVLLQALEQMNPKFPKPPQDLSAIRID